MDLELPFCSVAKKNCSVAKTSDDRTVFKKIDKRNAISKLGYFNGLLSVD